MAFDDVPNVHSARVMGIGLCKAARVARAQGKHLENGARMVARQAAAALAHFTGAKPDFNRMLASLAKPESVRVMACFRAIAAKITPPKHHNFAVGVLQAGYPIGAMLSGFVTAWALPIFGWQAILVATAVVFLIFGGVDLQGGFNMLYPIAALVYPDKVRAIGIGWAFGIGRIGAFTGPLAGG